MPRYRGSANYTKYASGKGVYGAIAGDTIVDDIVMYLAATYPKESERAVFSTTYFVQQNLRKEWKTYTQGLGAPSDLQRDRWYDIVRGGSSTKKPFYGSPDKGSRGLGNAFGYKKFIGKGRATIGWLSSSSARSGDRWQTGGSKTVSASEAIDYESAALKAGAKWEYKIALTKGRARKGRAKASKFKMIISKALPGYGLIVPEKGAVIKHKKNNKRTMFFDHFIGKYQMAIANTMRRKILEKLRMVPRGSTEMDIRLDFDQVGRGLQIQAFRFTGYQMSQLIARRFA